MLEPSPRSSRLAIAGSLVAVLAVGGAGFMLGRGAAPPAAPPRPIEQPAPAAPAAPAAQPVERALSRSDLIAFGAMAADAHVSTSGLPAEIATAAGRRFQLFLPFGCDGPAAEGSAAALRWRYDAEAEALRVHVAPVIWQPADWWPQPPERVEAMEGFWIERPWATGETCPPSSAPVSAAPGVQAITLPGQSLGVVQLISGSSSRQLGRDGKPYQATLRVPAGGLRIDQGLRLRLSGRIARFPGEGPVRCTQPGGSEQRPACLIAVEIDEVALENPQTEKTLATWTPAARPATGLDRARE